MAADAAVGFGAHLQGPVASGKQGLDGAGEGSKVGGVGDQQAAVAWMTCPGSRRPGWPRSAGPST